MAEQYLSKPSPHWIGDPTTTNMEYLALADVLAVNSGTSATNGTITLSLGVASTGEIFTINAMMFNAAGLYSVPLPAGTINSDGDFVPSDVSVDCSQAVCWVRNDQWTVLSIRDVREQSNPGNIEAGEICIQALGSQARIIQKADGSISLYSIAGNATGGKGLGLFLDAMGDTITLINSSGNGLQITPTGVSVMTNGAASGLTLGTDGSVNLIGTKQTQIDGANIVIGSQAIPGVNAALTGISGMQGVPSLKTIIQ